ncbi:hypothetical protein SGLAM104S_00591 [Streptomyces glaucescens]
MSRPSEWCAFVRCRAQGAAEKGSATEGPVKREVAARAARVVNTAAVLRSRGRGSGRGTENLRMRSGDTASSVWQIVSMRRKLREFGIAPPRTRHEHGPVTVALGPTRTAVSGPDRTTDPAAPELEPVRCPHCGSADTELLSRFSSTACKALRRCLACREPFDHFKEL